MAEQENLNNYDDEPVAYCAGCYSLKIKYEDAIDSDCCMECGCTDIREAPFEAWEKMYEQRYGHKYAEKSNDPRKSYIFNLSIKELKQKMYDSDNWKSVVKSMYPRFPDGYSKIDTILIFLDQIIKDNKLDDFKILLTKIQL